ncbi:hypothetical protein EI555_007559 [Monodon monoceros]|uniref:Uncharacterized protein n=1 Tax=Monodon monoceros TaxID=40151 RepID=A0A4U1FSD1_MONMO|nr:hypothetical protein EI555_007559 [Monodon monoceros]
MKIILLPCCQVGNQYYHWTKKLMKQLDFKVMHLSILANISYIYIQGQCWPKLICIY